MKYKIKYNNKSYFVKAKDAQSAIDGLSILVPELKDDRLSPMTYKKLKELGYTHEKWKDLSQEQANKIVQQNKPDAGSSVAKNVSNENKDILSIKNLPKLEREEAYKKYTDKIIVGKYKPTTQQKIHKTIKDIEKIFIADTPKKKQIRDEYINQIKDEPKITNDMIDVSKQLNLPLINLDFRVKTPNSFEKKVSRPETDLDKFEVTDSVRYTFTANKSTDVEKTLNALKKKGYKVVKFSNYWQPEDSAYRGINVKLKTDNNHIIEVQFHTVEDLLVKEYNHEKFYETQRNFAPDSEEYKHLDNLQKENTRDLITPKGMKTLRWDIQNKDK